ncbi:glycoside hydrolase family 95 protein [Marinifilum sp.]|uniref:glycoside hydrolase family 95 protein n=1 Tax=Marinifilum sp. TaxID=2033137 RepID=UPI003BA92EFE
MKQINITLYLAVTLLCVTFFSCTTSNQVELNQLKLWYDEPAEHFEQSLVLGNGKVGASVFGGVQSDKIYLNDATLWAGEPVDPNMNPDAHKSIPKVREALANEDYELADKLIRNVQGKFSESFAPLGTMHMDFNHKDSVSNYYRELNISNATSLTKYEVDGVRFEREYFISHPDQVMVIKLKANKNNALNFKVRFESLLKYDLTGNEDILRADGYAPYHAEPNYRGDMPNAVQFDENRGIRFSSYFKVKETDGEVFINDSILSVKDASEAVLLVSIATSFNGFDKDPVKEGKDNKAIAENQILKAEKKSFEEVRKSHITNHQTYFNRVELNLGAEDLTNIPTDERIKRYTAGAVDTDLEALYFQYGRYLLMAGSRTEGVPMNLQGIWNPYMRPPWSSNYTVNINVETNYWLAENTNLSEFHQPMLSWIKNVSKTGEVTAKTFLGVNGWTACHNSDIWAISNPVGDFGQGHPCWAAWFMGGAWLSTHLWEHYTFTQDQEYLKQVYPTIKGAAQFCLEWLVEGKNGNLMTSPGTSPENRFYTPDGYVASTLYGSTADLAMIRELFELTIKACNRLECDKDFKESLKTAHSRLQPYKVGSKGHLQEWFHDWEDVDKEHRHQTHLYGLFPGNHITTNDTVLANACRKTLEMRGPKGMGWSFGWRICLWSRLYDGENAHKVLQSLLRFVEPTGPHPDYSGGGGTYANLFSAAPPLQIDGNFSGAAGIAEMLLQSTEDEIRVIPAIPEAWSTGSFKGMCARGGFEIDASWKDKKLVELKVRSKVGKHCKLHFGDRIIDFDTKEGSEYSINSDFEVREL